MNSHALAAVLLSAASVTPGVSEPLLTRQDLYISGVDEVNIYRIPTLLVSAKGTLLAFCEAREGDDGDPTDIVLKRSATHGPADPPRMLNGYPRTFGYGVTWERMRVVLPGRGDAVMNQTPVVDPATGTIWLCCYEVKGGLSEHLKDVFAGRVLLTASDDDGLSWREPRDITPETGRFTPGPGVGIVLKSGRIVIPGYGPGARSKVIYSDDHCLTWRAGAPVEGATDESQVVELADGTLMLNMRSSRRRGCRYVALSRDGGETWASEADAPALPGPGCQASIVPYPLPGAAGRLLLFTNPASGGRANFTVRASRDEGKSWPISRLLDDGPAAYSGLAVLRDGTIGVLYETGAVHPYEKITFARFNLEWLLGAGQ